MFDLSVPASARLASVRARRRRGRLLSARPSTVPAVLRASVGTAVTVLPAPRTRVYGAARQRRAQVLCTVAPGACRRARQSASSTTESRPIAIIAVKVSGALRNVSIGERGEHDRGHRGREHDHQRVAAGVGAQPVGGGADDEEEHQRGGAADRRDRREVDEVGDDEHDAAGDQQAGLGAPRREPGPKNDGNSPSCASIPVIPPEA